MFDSPTFGRVRHARDRDASAAVVGATRTVYDYSVRRSETGTNTEESSRADDAGQLRHERSDVAVRKYARWPGCRPTLSPAALLVAEQRSRNQIWHDYDAVFEW
jgi:hypothetical protein